MIQDNRLLMELAKLTGNQIRFFDQVLLQADPISKRWISNESTRDLIGKELGLKDITMRKYVMELVDKKFLVKTKYRGVYEINERFFNIEMK